MTQTGRDDTPPAETAQDRARKVRDMSPADLISGPGALPDAPLDMPDQIIERPARTVWWLNNIFTRPPVAGNGV